MDARLGENRYGKSGVRLAVVTRGPDRHGFLDLTVDLRLEGGFEAAHVAGDNAAVLPTDTMRGAVYALAAEAPVRSIESFGLRLTGYLLDAAPAATRAEVGIEEQPWERIPAVGGPHPHAFARAAHRWTARVVRTRERAEVEAGVTGLAILKTAGSAFSGFLRDRYTTLQETEDRILATSITASWGSARPDPDADHARLREEAVRVLLETFAGHESRSVQHTLYAMGEAVLRALPDVAWVRLVLPNLHHVAVDLSPYGLENRNEIFAVPDRPFGVIEGTVTRADLAGS